jgi:restriction system protein
MEYLPKSQELIFPMMIFLASQNGPVSIDQIEAAVGRKLAIPDVLLTAIHSGKRTEFQYRLAWARTKAKSTGWIFSPKREYWEITNLGKSQFSS